MFLSWVAWVCFGFCRNLTLLFSSNPISFITYIISNIFCSSSWQRRKAGDFLSQYFFLNIFSIFCMLLRHKVFFSFDHVSFQGGIWWICGDWSAKWIVCFGKIDWIHWLVSFCGKLKRLWRIKIYRERSGPTKKGGGGMDRQTCQRAVWKFRPFQVRPLLFLPTSTSSSHQKRICLLRLFLDSFVGHYLDQKRLKMGLYRHPWDDITYIMPDHLTDLRPASFE